jgi:hypothetical protein
VRTIEWIVLHSAGAVDKQGKAVHQSIGVIRNYHREHNGWSDIGYHWYVEHDGQGKRGLEDAVVGAHVKGFNAHSLGLCVSGHGDYETWNQDQRNEVVRQCVAWCVKYRLRAEQVIGHHEADEHGVAPILKTCPGRLIDLVGLRRMVGEALEVLNRPSAPPTLEERVAKLERQVQALLCPGG